MKRSNTGPNGNRTDQKKARRSWLKRWRSSASSSSTPGGAISGDDLHDWILTNASSAWMDTLRTTPIYTTTNTNSTPWVTSYYENWKTPKWEPPLRDRLHEEWCGCDDRECEYRNRICPARAWDLEYGSFFSGISVTGRWTVP